MDSYFEAAWNCIIDALQIWSDGNIEPIISLTARNESYPVVLRNALVKLGEIIHADAGINFWQFGDKLQTLGELNGFQEILTDLFHGASFEKKKPDPGRFTPLTAYDLLKFQDAEWLVEDILYKSTISCLFGPSGVGKSFITLDLCLRVASGLTWMGRHVERGRSVYAAAEGEQGIKKRVMAWLQYNRVDIDEISLFTVFTQEPQFLDPRSVHFFTEELKKMIPLPSFISFDTLAKTLVGYEESNKEFGMAIQGCEAIKRETGAHIQLNHHTGKDERNIRGGYALPAGIDTVIEASGDPDAVLLECRKQKDSEEFKPIHMRLYNIALGLDLKKRPISSMAAGPFVPRVTEDDPCANPRLAQLYSVLCQSSFSDGVAAITLEKVVGMSHRTLYRSLSLLKDFGYAENERGKWKGIRKP
jgi:hypothetical protein